MTQKKSSEVVAEARLHVANSQEETDGGTKQGVRSSSIEPNGNEVGREHRGYFRCDSRSTEHSLYGWQGILNRQNQVGGSLLLRQESNGERSNESGRLRTCGTRRTSYEVTQVSAEALGLSQDRGAAPRMADLAGLEGSCPSKRKTSLVAPQDFMFINVAPQSRLAAEEAFEDSARLIVGIFWALLLTAAGAGMIYGISAACLWLRHFGERFHL
jgi:hypothetical protein